MILGILASLALLPLRACLHQGRLQTAADVEFAHSCGAVLPSWICAKIPTLLTLICGALYALAALSEGRRKALRAQARPLGRLRAGIFRRFAYFQPASALIGVRVLALSSPVDEALGALTGSWWLHRVNLWLARALAATCILSGICGSAYVLFWLTTVEVRLRTHAVLHVLFRDWGRVVVAVIFAVIFGLIAMILAFIGRLASMTNIGLGLENPESNLLWTASAHRAFVASAEITARRYPLLALLRNANGLLFHSRLYAYSPAIADIAEWLSLQATSRDANAC